MLCPAKSKNVIFGRLWDFSGTCLTASIILDIVSFFGFLMIFSELSLRTSLPRLLFLVSSKSYICVCNWFGCDWSMSLPTSCTDAILSEDANKGTSSLGCTYCPRAIQSSLKSAFLSLSFLTDFMPVVLLFISSW